ncbi:uncharacterized protein LOC112350506 [Selaginella moellendorffii]|uniref:uncharacterized protein LOC112350506 n=1 Tax=Selaginella moellendorffii TaxID=88036 RepID=UPI000D1C4709|nr:uncharacterized protein LOC112350506 [Selaginella moellendorffii]XP_024542600.1 uncharacterized protein LOC112350506 [Selaginella moellendorffii]|eukprot:XP_024542599.1 uncharacterized protein LOC112350506 [Selaginella moellendorffii]
MFSWREYADTRLMHQKHMCTAIHYHMISSLSRCFSDWKMARQEKQKKEFYKKVAYAKWNFSRQRFALRAWNCFLVLKHEKASITEARRLKNLSMCFHFWYSTRKSLSVSDSESESSVDSLLEKDTLFLVVDSHFKRKKQRHILCAWSKLAKSRSSSKLTIDTFYRDKVLFNILHESLQCWIKYHFSIKFRRAQQNKAVRYWTFYRLRSCMRWWLRYKTSKASKQRCKSLATKHWESGTAMNSLYRWIDYCYWNKSRQEKQGLASRQWRGFRLKGIFHRWMEFSSASKRKRDMIDKARDGRVELVIRKGLSAWISFVRGRKRRKMAMEKQCEELMELLDSSRLANTWKLWQRFVRDGVTKSRKYEKAEIFCREHSARAVLRAWHNLQAPLSSKHQAGVFYTKLLQRLAFLGWFQVQKSKSSVRKSQSLSPQQQQDHAVKVPDLSRSRETTGTELLEQFENDSKGMKNGRLRPPPRRPALPLTDVRHSLLSQSPAFDSSSLSAQSGTRDYLPSFSLPTRPDDSDPYLLLQKRLNKDSKELLTRTATATAPSLEFLDSSETEFSHVIADEVAWMDHLLAGFEDLRAELVEKRAELALVLERNGSGSRDKAQLLTQKISMLQQRRAILLPTIQAVASVVPGLRLRARKVTSSSMESSSNFRK